MRIAYLLVVVAACGSSATDWLPSDIDRGQTLDRLGTAGYSRMCQAFEDFVRDEYASSYLVQAACTANALQTTSDAAACGESVDACLDTLPPVVEDQLQTILAQASCSKLELSVTGCAATVLDMKHCLDALSEKLDTIELSATCAAFGSPVPSDWWMISLPAECTSITTDC